LEQGELSCCFNLQMHTHDDSSAFAPVHIEYSLYYSIIYESCTYMLKNILYNFNADSTSALTNYYTLYMLSETVKFITDAQYCIII